MTIQHPGFSVSDLEIFWHVSSNLGAVPRTEIFPHKIYEKIKKKKSWSASGEQKNRHHGQQRKGTAESFSR